MSVSVQFKTAGARRKLTSMLGNIVGDVSIVLDAVAEAATQRAKGSIQFKDRTGELRKNIRWSIAGSFTRKVKAYTKYATFVEYGTRPHEIWARRAPYLVFQIGGRWFRKIMVHHPGTKPRPFMGDARDMAAPLLREKIEQFTQRVIQRHNM